MLWSIIKLFNARLKSSCLVSYFSSVAANMHLEKHVIFKIPINLVEFHLNCISCIREVYFLYIDKLIQVYVLMKERLN
jgi:hypothetical protein